MNDALIGWSGYVGSTLLRQHAFADMFRSRDIERIRGLEFDTIFCAGAPAQKWIANREPAADEACIGRLMDALGGARCRRFVLISTVDVFRVPVGVDEGSVVDEDDLHPYGLNRRRLEQFVEAQYPASTIIRLPGLVGPGLRKNVLFDFLHGNGLDKVDCRAVFQFYPMVNLAQDIETALQSDLRLVHLTAAPLSVADAARQGFGLDFGNSLPGPPARYDLRSRYAALFGGSGEYQYSARESIQAIRSYAQSEARNPTGFDA